MVNVDYYNIIVLVFGVSNSIILIFSASNKTILHKILFK